MRSLITGDLRRSLRKKAFPILLGLALVMTIAMAVYIMRTYWNGYNFFSMQTDISAGSMNLLFGLIIFLTVYGDDFQSKAMTIVIGGGISRKKYILAKLADTVILMTFCTLVMALILTIASLVLRAGMTGEEYKVMYIILFVDAYKMVGYIVFAVFFLFLTGNIPFATIILILSSKLLPILLPYATTNRAIRMFHLDRWYFSGMADVAQSDLILGMTGEGIFLLILGAVLYMGFNILVTILVFEKKEMDF